MKGSIGPWTTAMDTGSGTRRSTFWEKRLTMLPIVRHSRAVVTRRARLLLAVAATLALVLPTLHLSRSEAAVEAEPEKLAAGKPLVLMLPAGLVAEVIGVGHNPSKGEPCWAPDGTPIAAPYEKIDATTRAGAEEVSREVALRWVHQPPGVTVRATPNARSWSAGCRAFDASGKELPGVRVLAGTFLKTQDTCKIHFKIAAGPWETLTENPGRGFVTYGEKNQGYAFSRAIEIDGATQITISHDIHDREVRVVAVDHQGREIATENRGGGDVRGFSQQTVIFYQLPLKDIKVFRVQARNWQQVEVTGIALNPGEMTQPAPPTQPPN